MYGQLHTCIGNGRSRRKPRKRGRGRNLSVDSRNIHYFSNALPVQRVKLPFLKSCFLTFIAIILKWWPLLASHGFPFTLSFRSMCLITCSQLSKSCKNFSSMSAHADGGPRSRSANAWPFARPPINMSGNFPAHVSAGWRVWAGRDCSNGEEEWGFASWKSVAQRKESNCSDPQKWFQHLELD